MKLLILLLLIPTVYAVSYGVSPSTIELEMPAGSTEEYSIMLSRPANQTPMTVHIKTEASSWITVPEKIYLDTNRYSVPITITVPSSPGMHSEKIEFIVVEKGSQFDTILKIQSTVKVKVTKKRLAPFFAIPILLAAGFVYWMRGK